MELTGITRLESRFWEWRFQHCGLEKAGPHVLTASGSGFCCNGSAGWRAKVSLAVKCRL